MLVSHLTCSRANMAGNDADLQAAIKYQGPGRRWCYLPWTEEQAKSCEYSSLDTTLKQKVEFVASKTRASTRSQTEEVGRLPSSKQVAQRQRNNKKEQILRENESVVDDREDEDLVEGL